ncbi:MAG: hypothetical protein RJB13_662 [Pseudomonadota bacterium]
MSEMPLYLDYSEDILEAAFDLITSYATNSDKKECQLIFLKRVNNANRKSSDSSKNLIKKHISIASEVVSIRSLPFLTSEMSESLTRLQNELFASWNLLLSTNSQLSEAFRYPEASVFENIDSLILTFLEWMSDVDFLEASGIEQQRYLSEFPSDITVVVVDKGI